MKKSDLYIQNYFCSTEKILSFTVHYDNIFLIIAPLIT